MAYVKHTWTHEEVITRQNLNHMEQGIYDNSVAISQFVAAAVFEATLVAGETTITITDDTIAVANSIRIKTSNGIAPTSQSVSGSTYTATFVAMDTDLYVLVEVA